MLRMSPPKADIEIGILAPPKARLLILKKPSLLWGLMRRYGLSGSSVILSR